MDSQYHEEILRRTGLQRFHIPIRWWLHCAKRVQGRYRLETSDALGTAAVQVGPEAYAC
jgi:transposase